MEEFHESSVVLPLGKYHSTSTIASSRLRLAAVRGAVYPQSCRLALRVQITLQLGRYAANAHRDPNILHPNFSKRPNPQGEIQHRKWLRIHDEAFDRSREEFAKHFKTKYPGEDPPIWTAAELWDFGAMRQRFWPERAVLKYVGNLIVLLAIGNHGAKMHLLVDHLRGDTDGKEKLWWWKTL